MAIAFVGAAEDKTVAGTVLTYAFDATGSNFLYVHFTTLSNTHTITSVTYAGVNMTALQTQALAFSPTWRHHGYYLVNPTTGSNNVVITCVAIDFTIRSGCMGYSGVDTSNPIITSNKYDSDGAGNDVPVALTTGAAGWWVMSAANPDAVFVAGTITNTLRCSYSGLSDSADSNDDVAAQTANANMSFTGTREGGGVAFAMRATSSTAKSSNFLLMGVG